MNIRIKPEIKGTGATAVCEGYLVMFLGEDGVTVITTVGGFADEAAAGAFVRAFIVDVTFSAKLASLRGRKP